MHKYATYGCQSKLIKAGCVQSKRLSLWSKCEDEFTTAWLPCQSLTGQVRPKQTRCTDAVVTR